MDRKPIIMENNGIRDGNYTKEFFALAWGPDGYYEQFDYGVGIEQVCDIALYPFLHSYQGVLEIGSGGGTFTKRILGRSFRSFTAIDVIPKPEHIHFGAEDTYVELPDQCYRCQGVRDSSMEFVFSYNVFCHLSDDALREYMTDIARVLRPNGDLVFMLSDFEKVSRLYFPETAGQFKRGNLLPNGHFYQDQQTPYLVAAAEDWIFVSVDMIPAHRDRLVHLRRK